MPDKETTLFITGKVISPGLAEGRIFIHRDMLRHLDTPVAIETESVEQELDHLEDATAMITEDLLVLATRVEKEMDSRLAAVFETHQLILNDPALKEELRTEIRGNLVSASSAVKAVFLRWEKRFLMMESRMARQKGDDMRDISDRLSNALAGIKIHPLEQIPPGSVLVANRLLPSETIFLSQNSTAAVLLEYGGSGSHAALFAREMGMPCIVNIPMILKKVPANAWVLVDANLGEVIVHPQEEHKAGFQKKVSAMQETFVAAQERAKKQAVTLDGVTIAVFANVGCYADTARAMTNGADGIGLYRTEQAYMGRMTPPDVDELLDEMRRTLEPAKGKPVYVRLLDIGADKPLPFIGFLAETNPALGRRGIRLLREYPHLLETQLQAMLKLSQEFDVRILIPMASLPEDIVKVKECLTRLGEEMGISPLPKLGAMIETPAAALSALAMEPHVDFLSFGTNDLTQYSFAADRENAAVEQYFKDSADVIFRLLRITHDDVPDMPLSVCGELAGRAAHIPKLLQCGIRSLSVAPPLIPIIKETIRESLYNVTNSC
ncbi:MAG: phosphoenolpyruvate--protein phosphotransferase [Lentisphaerae bacterium RIFOXYA12_FULL_48_11]|nr:MAG: phosphoenolpyruvate--protein phosphotransferase [Lentisphaerae bacterium RIFOXYA12_FULL_48_11]